jgi:very-short-patch-repair endonuclease
VVDFCSPRRKLVIELDGSPHLEHREADTDRAEYLVSLGYQVLRFWNSQVMNNIEGVLGAIAQALEDKEGAADT